MGIQKSHQKTVASFAAQKKKHANSAKVLSEIEHREKVYMQSSKKPVRK